MEKRISSGQKKAISYNQAYEFMQECLEKQKRLDESITREIHKKTMSYSTSVSGGIYRDHNVYISDATHDFPTSEELPLLMRTFYQNLSEKTDICGMPEMLHPVELAAWTHNEFVCIHPFTNGNGRTARLLMNYQLQTYGYLPVNIPVAQAKKYYSILDNYYNDRDVEPATNFISALLVQSYKKLNSHMNKIEHQDIKKSTTADRMVKRMMEGKGNDKSKKREIEF